MSHTPLAPYIGDRTPRILVVDDEPANREVLEDHLTQLGCVVSTAANGQEALSAVSGFNPDLIVLDIVMPGLSGFDVCDALRAGLATKDIPVVFLTALSTEESKIRGFDAGAFDYITKPFIVADLVSRVGARLRQKYAEDKLRTRNKELTERLATKHSKKAAEAGE